MGIGLKQPRVFARLFRRHQSPARIGVIWENKAIHYPDRSQLLLDLIVTVATVAKAAPAASVMQKSWLLDIASSC